MAKRFTREAIINSKKFDYIQKDFLAALLPKPKYTLAEVVKIIEKWEKGES